MHRQYLIIDLRAWAKLSPRSDRMDITLERFMGSNEVRTHINLSDNDGIHGHNLAPFEKLTKSIDTYTDSDIDKLCKP